MHKLLTATALALFAFACGSSQSAAPVDPVDTTDPADTTDTTDTTEVTPPEEPPPEEPVSGLIIVTADQLEWTPLDPNAGEAGPMIAQAWGDAASGPSGMFFKAPAKFPGGPHLHTSNYHGIVISGTVRNDKPKAKAPVLMPSGSYWAQPGGAAHVTSCKDECMAFIYFEGPFDGLPPDAKVPATEMKAKNVVPKQLKWVPGSEAGKAGPMLAPLWGDMETGPNGFLVKLPAGFAGAWHWHTSDYHGATIQGVARNWEQSGNADIALPAGASWFQPGEVNHTTSCDAGKECIIYVQMDGVADSHMKDEAGDDDDDDDDM